MKKPILVLAAALAGCIVFACSAPPSELNPTFTVRDIMKSMVQTNADVLWNAVAISVTAKGLETKAPKSDEELAAGRGRFSSGNREDRA